MRNPPKFSDNRALIITYTAFVQLDERHDVNILLIHCIKTDLNSSTQFIQVNIYARLGYILCKILIIGYWSDPSIYLPYTQITSLIQGLALCTLGSIASGDMARDLAPEVEKLIKSSNAYIRNTSDIIAILIKKYLKSTIYWTEMVCFASTKLN